jgi:hypothetical protein
MPTTVNFRAYHQSLKAFLCSRDWDSAGGSAVKTVAVIFVATLFGFPSTSLSTEKRPVTPYRAESSAYVVNDKDTTTYVTENRSFHFAEILGDDGIYEDVLLLEETYHSQHTDGMDEVRGNATVKAWTMQGGHRGELRWTFKENGNEGGVRDRFFRITAWGCCDSPTVYFYYNVLTGKKLYISNSDLLEVWGDGDGPQAWRYVAFGYAGVHDLSRPPQLQYGWEEREVYATLSSLQKPRQRRRQQETTHFLYS